MDSTAGASNSDTSASVTAQPSVCAQSLELAIKGTKVRGYLERAWDRAALPVIGITSTFLAATGFGMWQHVPPSARMAGVALFAVALAAAIAPLRKVRVPTREQALERMDKATGLPGRLASTYDDIPVKESDAQSRVIWELQRSRIERKVGAFKAAPLRSTLPARDPMALRYAMALIAGLAVTGAISEDQAMNRFAAAFDFQTGLTANMAKIDAYVTPPKYTGKAPIYIASTKQGKEAAEDAAYEVPESSILTLRLHDPHARVTATGGSAKPEDSCKPSGEITQCDLELSSNAQITVKSPRTGEVVWQFNVTADLPPQVALAPTPKAEEDKPGPAGATYTVVDEYAGAEAVRARIVLPEGLQQEPGARPLSIFKAPALTIQIK